ncbi:hypothetical protein E6O75_ATG10490 [Venturia nashicola]|uniref:Uncharacterized protein n=1 Tax=Venturia nashicola TaxID=86259 RepID=A0A4Z1P931_9PEZI|nr:hypothetical protein E6O75_ATG10490 [Venturia nashicola]
MDPFQAIYPPGFRPRNGVEPFGPSSGAGNLDASQTANPTPTNNPNQPSGGGSSSTDAFTVPASASVLSINGASITAPLGSSSTIGGDQSSSPVSTLYDSASAPISTLFNSAAGNFGSGTSVITSIVAMSTTTVTGLSNASASAAKLAGGTEDLTTGTPEPVLRDQTVIGVAVGIGIWLLIIIAALSWCLWRKRNIRERGERLDDDNATSMPRNMSQSDVEAIMGMAPARPAVARSRSLAPTIPPPAFLTRSRSTMDVMPGPLESHPISRTASYSHDDREEMSSLSLFEYGNLGSRLSAPPRSPSTPFPGAQRISHSSDVTSSSSQTSRRPRTLAQTRALSTTSNPERGTTPGPIAALPPSLGKLNSWLEENRRRSRRTASSSGVGMDLPRPTNTTREEIEKGEEEDDMIKEPGRIRADSGTLGTGPPIMSSRAGPAVPRPMSLASLKDVYRRSAGLEKVLKENSTISEKEVRPDTPAK